MAPAQALANLTLVFFPLSVYIPMMLCYFNSYWNENDDTPLSSSQKKKKWRRKTCSLNSWCSLLSFCHHGGRKTCEHACTYVCMCTLMHACTHALRDTRTHRMQLQYLLTMNFQPVCPPQHHIHIKCCIWSNQFRERFTLSFEYITD